MSLPASALPRRVPLANEGIGYMVTSAKPKYGELALADHALLLVKPRAACRLLACGNTRLYELLAAGELDSFLDGRSRKITIESIRRYVARRLNNNEAKTA
jgi:hypothetical protein